MKQRVFRKGGYRTIVVGGSDCIGMRRYDVAFIRRDGGYIVMDILMQSDEKARQYARMINAKALYRVNEGKNFVKGSRMYTPMDF